VRPLRADPAKTPSSGGADGPRISTSGPSVLDPEDFVRLQCSLPIGTGGSHFDYMATMRKSRPREQRSDAARNREALVRAATAAVHRDGPRATMATIAADAGVGIGTLYRHFPTRDDLLNSLTHRSFEQVLANVRAADSDAATASDALRRFIDAAITQRNELVLPLHGGLPVTLRETLAVRDQVHRALQGIIERGRTDGTISQDVTPREVVVFGAMLAQPRQSDPGWDTTCRRLLATYINGLRAC
jgi:AcrR family transcriptional regulator